MGEVLALGMTHYPALVNPDERMAGILRWVLEDEAIPAEHKDPAAWPAAMREEYGDDGGTASAAVHRERCLAAFRRLRSELDEFRPDVVVIWGDDQYENFREEIIPPFCLFALDDLKLRPWQHSRAANVWGEPADEVLPVRGAKDMAKHFASAMLADGVDLAYSYRLRDETIAPHAFLNTLLFLDYDRTGFPYPVIPFQVNCYGSYVIARHGEPTRFGHADAPEDLDPPGPTPQRAMEVGAAFARAAAASPWRVAVIGSSSWSHAFLHDKAWRLYPDIASDEEYYRAMVEQDYAVWEAATPEGLAASGQQEMLNWFCLLGAVKELGAAPTWTELVTTRVFNSSKCFAIFR
ncbi:extradiol ring-cleavage dioxygenase [Pseudonocardia sp.]|uniref:extradiol ring-cleavage dioxygenase n=1 Tax=Pseudonocardia sp. TaxID=60912 RepID=UPI00262759A1|nr:extradiol ring-cleavage dioxygenase [Pseudonocardia sp.]